MRKSILVLITACWLTACSNVGVATYRGNEPRLDPREFFDGSLSAHGVVKNRGGKVIRYFNATINAYWRDGVGTLEEDFLFDDGERQQRGWTLVPQGDGRYYATAGDVIGTGEGEFAGNSFFLNYVLRVPYGDGTIDLNIDDRMYRVNENTLINESGMYKFGFRVGSILSVIQKR